MSKRFSVAQWAITAALISVAHAAFAASPTDTFVATGSLLTPRDNATSTLLPNGQVLIAGGAGSAGVLSTAELYDPNTGTFHATGGLKTARQLATATMLSNGQVLVAGGEDKSGNALLSAELYSVAMGTFNTIGTMATARYFANQGLSR